MTQNHISEPEVFRSGRAMNSRGTPINRIDTVSPKTRNERVLAAAPATAGDIIEAT